MRGKDEFGIILPFCDRITPAYAGKSHFFLPRFIVSWDHPRLCGEKIEERNPSDYVLGSPPPMRGKAHKSSGTAFSIRITPAYAGKSWNTSENVQPAQDHPRLCGEKFKNYVDLFHDKGSPPPMRGKVNHDRLYDADDRITPAYAGKSSMNE